MNSSKIRLSTALLGVLVLLSAVAPLATDLYLAAFPAMVEDLAATDASIKLTLTMFLVGLAVGQLVFGPLSDRFGRRAPLVVGTGLFVLASVGAAVAPSIELLLVARFVQGLSGASGSVIGRAIVADLARRKEAARLFSLMMVVGGIAPVVAPLLGSVLFEFIDWRGVLWVLAGAALLMFVGSGVVIRETLPRDRRRMGGEGAGFEYLTSWAYASATATFACAFAVLMAYIASSPFIYQELMGFSSLSFGIAFAINSTGLIMGSAISRKLLVTWSINEVIRVGLIGAGASAAAVSAMAITGAPVKFLVVPLFAAVMSMGFIFGPATAAALEASRGASGLGSAVLGCSQYLVGAVASALVGLGSGVVGLAVVMVVFAGLAVTAYTILIRQPVARPSSNVEAISESITA